MNRQCIIADIRRGVLLAAAGDRAIGAERLIRRSAFCAERDLIVAHEAGLIRALKTIDRSCRLRVVMRLRHIRLRHAPDHAAVHRGQASPPVDRASATISASRLLDFPLSTIEYNSSLCIQRDAFPRVSWQLLAAPAFCHTGLAPNR